MKDFEALLKTKLHKAIDDTVGKMAEEGTHWPGQYISADTIHYAADAAACVILGAIDSQAEAESEGIIKTI
jgi:hypothetical protein